MLGFAVSISPSADRRTIHAAVTPATAASAQSPSGGAGESALAAVGSSAVPGTTTTGASGLLGGVPVATVTALEQLCFLLPLRRPPSCCSVGGSEAGGAGSNAGDLPKRRNKRQPRSKPTQAVGTDSRAGSGGPGEDDSKMRDDPEAVGGGGTAGEVKARGSGRAEDASDDEEDAGESEDEEEDDAVEADEVWQWLQAVFDNPQVGPVFSGLPMPTVV